MKQYRLKDEYVLRKFKESNYVINIDTGDIRNFSEVGYLILQQCNQATTAVAIAREFGVGEELQEEFGKIENFLELLVSNKILELI